MEIKTVKNNAVSLLVVSMLLVLPSCGLVDWVKDKFGGGTTPTASSSAGMMEIATTPAGTDGSAVLVTISGKPLITQTMLDTEKQKLLASNPQLQAMISLMDEKQLNRNLVDGMASREIIRKYVADNNIEASDKYKQDYEMVLAQVRDALNTRYFMDAFSVSVTDGEIKKFYDENKDAIPNLLLSRGGVEAVAASFDDEKSARDFAAKAKGMRNDVSRAAAEAGLTDKVKDFKLVSDQSLGIEPELRDKIIDIKSVPSINTFKIGKEYWVVAASKKEEPKYRDLDQVKEELKQLIEKEKTMKKFEEEVARLKSEYKIEVDESFFASQADNAGAFQAAGDSDLAEEGSKSIKTSDASSDADSAPKTALA